MAGRVIAGAVAVGVVALGYVAVTLPDVRPLIGAPPIETSFMRVRAREANAEGRPALRDYRFVPYARIAQTLKRAVLVTEDSGFWEHDGIELDSIRESLEANLASGAIVRGGSTITQQLAKNLYLSPSQNPLRKMRELMITHRLERLMSKRRILELYLNVVEWGGGTWGAEAASRRYFRKSSAGLAPSEAALLAGALINPNRYSPADPPLRLRRRQQMILRRMGMRGAPVPPAEHEAAATAGVGPETTVPPSAPSPSPPPTSGQPDQAPPPAPEPAPEPDVQPPMTSPAEPHARPEPPPSPRA